MRQKQIEKKAKKKKSTGICNYNGKKQIIHL